MTWSNFLTWLIGIYLFYYAANLLYDLSFKRKRTTRSNSIELDFSENKPPKKIVAREKPEDKFLPLIEPVSVGLGGVSLAELFELARTDAIDFTTNVSF